MIIRHVPMESVQKSNFTDLVEYMTDPNDRNERVGNVTITNCQSQRVETAMLEIINTQRLNTLSKADKTYHLVVAFPVGELPDAATLKAIEERICVVIGFGEHQRVSAVHHDTDNLHLHIAINKIHPTRYTTHEPFNAYHLLGQLCDKLEVEYGFQKVNHQANKNRSENRAADMERHSDVESLLGWIKRECQDQILGAQSWSSLHQVMRDHGLEICEHANGLIISANNGVSVKASSVHRKFSKKNLEGRLGSFTKSQVAATDSPQKQYEKKPMRSMVNTVELYARYKQAQQLAMDARVAEWAKAVARKNHLLEDAKRAGRLKRAAVKFSGSPGLGKRLMYAFINKTRHDDIAAATKAYMREREAIYTKYKRMAWADWLRKEAMAGDQEALEALRSREASTGLRGNTVAGKGGAKNSAAPPSRHDNITKRGTIIYRVGASAVRDDGDKLNVSRGADDAALQVALRMAVERYGITITVDGTAAFKEQIARAAAAGNLTISFDDAALEARRRQLIQSKTTKERKHGSNIRIDKREVRGQQDRGGDGRHGQSATGAADAASAARAGAAAPARQRHAASVKPDTGKAGKNPPPLARHAVRGMPELDLVHVAERGEMLLQGHVPGGVGQQGAKPNNRVRRDIRGPGRVRPSGAHPAPATKADHGGKPNIGKLGRVPPPASKDRLRPLSQLGAISIGAHGTAAAAPHPAPMTEPQPAATTTEHMEATNRRDLLGSDKTLPGNAAAEKYVNEREQKRAKQFDIPKQMKYTFTNDIKMIFHGMRQIDGQTLALLKQGDELIALPVDDATARRLKLLAVGEHILVTARGVIKTKGRSR
ncbi:TraI/MobA(P) family conjugative relaxase [Massilia glaciei]|uniref:Conjugal transfer protein TraI n=1 Tax=Massilia glaciei TaxID=1524097 RepID=A0A2U2I5D7_9BURK|nr:TraI/MobA(P) family conjugative relaxase [Massilia glaciei]PWF54983.1 conjugal transfer protein TraI [Massilia glaciei]